MSKDLKNKVKILVFDTETSGLPKNYKPAEEDMNNYPHLLQFSAQLVEFDLDNPLHPEVLYGCNFYVTPFRDGKEIQIHPKAVETHGIDFNKANALGENIHTVLMVFLGLCNAADYIVCHNYTLDRNVMVSEFLRLGLPYKYRPKTKIFCTMKYSTGLLKLPGYKPNQFKFPRLEELFQFLTGASMHDYYKAHDAEGDVNATVVCVGHLIHQQEEVREWFKGGEKSIY